MLSLFFSVFHWHLCYQSVQISPVIFQKLIHITNVLLTVMSNFRFFQYAQFYWHCNSQKSFGWSFRITTLNPKTYHELQNVKDNMKLSKTKSLKVCNMITLSQKSIFLLPSVENLTACVGQCSTANAELRCGGGSDWMK